ncbi:50S ribosomal protein L2 [Candidatus Woesearchaeota archaeon]|nr:50S ribosomal protein L2 [Candidatus Woesearchaeota archaeon]
MGKRLIQQRRGRGTTKYISTSFRYKGDATIPNIEGEGIIREFYRDAIHSAPLMEVMVNDSKILMVAPEGVRTGQKIYIGGSAEISPGNVLPLESIPEGIPIYNIEKVPGDGGKFVRASGTSARIVMKTDKGVIVELPSKKRRVFHPKCRAVIGIVAGGGRPEKPLVKAGKAYHIMRAKHKRYPIVKGVAMNAVDHPHGGSRSSHKGRPTIAPHNAPPGRKVGKIRPRRTGKRKK